MARPRPRDARASAVSAGSQHLLAALGIWPSLADHAQPVTASTSPILSWTMRSVPSSCPTTTRSKADEPATYIVENGRLTAALRAAAVQRSSLALIGGAAAVDFAAGEQGVVRDPCRRSPLARAAARGSRRACVAVCARPPASASSAGTIRRWASSPRFATRSRTASRAVQHFLPSGPFAILPLHGNRSCVTWTEEEGQGRAIMALDDAGFLAEVEKRFGYRLGGVELDRAARRLAAGNASGARDGGGSLGARRRCRASGASDRGAGVEPGLQGRGGADGGGGRCCAARPRCRLQQVLARYERWRRIGLGAVGRRVRRLEPAVLQRLDAVAHGAQRRSRR